MPNAPTDTPPNANSNERPIMWKTPRRKALNPSGITLGTSVTGFGRVLSWQSETRVTGQVWSRAAAPSSRSRGRWWWVVGADGCAYLCAEADLVAAGQCGDVALFTAVA